MRRFVDLVALADILDLKTTSEDIGEPPFGLHEPEITELKYRHGQQCHDPKHTPVRPLTEHQDLTRGLHERSQPIFSTFKTTSEDIHLTAFPIWPTLPTGRLYPDQPGEVFLSLQHPDRFLNTRYA